MLGLILVILAQVAYAFGGLVIKKYLSNYPPVMVSGLMALVSIILFAPILFFSYRSEITGLTVKSAFPFIIAGILWLVIAEILYITGFQKSSSISLASLMTLFYPLFSTILGILFLGETFTVKTIIAALLMIGGFVLLII